MNMHLLRGALCALSIASALPAGAVELASNGGFETGDFTGWSPFGGINQTNVNVNDAVTGTYGARFSPNSPGGITQDIATVAGTSYLVSWDLTKYANPNLAPANFIDVTFDGVVLLSLTDTASFGLTSYSVARVASGPLSTLSFTFRDNWDGPNNRWSLDNVSVSGLGRNLGAVPEPATWAMLLLGFGLVGHVARRNRRAIPA